MPPQDPQQLGLDPETLLPIGTRSTAPESLGLDPETLLPVGTASEPAAAESQAQQLGLDPVTLLPVGASDAADEDFVGPPAPERSFIDRINLLAEGPRRKVGEQLRGLPSGIVSASQFARETVEQTGAGLARAFTDPQAFEGAVAEALDLVDKTQRILTPGTEEATEAGGAVVDVGKQIVDDVIATAKDPAKAVEDQGIFALMDLVDLMLVAGGGVGAVTAVARGEGARLLARRGAQGAAEAAVERGAREAVEETGPRLLNAAPGVENIGPVGTMELASAPTPAEGLLPLTDEALGKARELQRRIKNRASEAARSDAREAAALEEASAFFDDLASPRQGLPRERRERLDSLLARRGVDRSVTNELLDVMGQMQGASSDVAQAVDTSVIEAVQRNVTSLSPEFLERTGRSFERSGMPARLGRRIRKGGPASINEFADELADLFPTRNDPMFSRVAAGREANIPLTEDDVVQIILGPSPTEARTNQAAEALLGFGFADNSNEALELARLFDPENLDTTFNVLVRGPGSEKNPNRRYRDMLAFVEARVNARNASVDTARAVERVGFSAAPNDVSAQFALGAAPRTIVEAPAFVRGNGDDSGLILAQLRGDIRPPISAAPDATRATEALRARVQNAVDGGVVSDTDLRRINMGIHGRTVLPDSTAELKAVAEYVDGIRTGVSSAPMNRQQIMALRNGFGRKALRDKASTVGVDFKHGAPAKGKDVLEASAGPSPLDTIKDVGLLGWVRDFDKAVPEAAAVLRPAIEGMHEEVADLSAKWAKLTKGIKQGSRFDREIARLLNGDFGGLEDLQRMAPGKRPVSKRSLDIALEARRDLDSLFVRLRREIPELKYHEAYITFLRDEYGTRNLMPPDVIRYSGRKASFKFLRRLNEAAPADLSFIESMSVYIPTAVRKVHMDPAFRQLDEVRASFDASGAGRKEMLTNMMVDRLQGVPTPIEQNLDLSIVRAGEKLGIDFGARPTMRLSMLMATGFYRGILGGNISAAVNNMTQTVNTMAEAGVLPTMRGAMLFAADESSTVLRNQMRRLGVSAGGIEETIARKAKLQRQWTALFEENRRARSLLGKPVALGWSFDDVIFAPFNFAEYVNRGIAFHTGVGKELAARGFRSIDEARAAGVFDDIVQQGRLLSQNTQFMYDELSRSPIFRGPVGRQFGVLTSFPIKQAEFLKELTQQTARGEGLGILRYFAVTGFAAWATEEQLGVQLNAFAPMRVAGVEPPLRGLEFLGQLEGAPLGASPFGQVFVTAGGVLRAAADGRPEEMVAAVGELVDSFSNVVPLAVATKEVIGAAEDARARVRRRRLGGVPGLRESGPETLGAGASAQVPGAGMAAPVGDVMETTTVGREILRLAGMTPIESAEVRKLTDELSRFLRRRRGGGGGSSATVARANDIAGFLVREGEHPQAREVLRAAGGSAEGFERSFAAGELTLLERVWGRTSQSEQARFLAENQELQPVLRRTLKRVARERREARR